jgi:hypothetical protein
MTFVDTRCLRAELVLREPTPRERRLPIFGMMLSERRQNKIGRDLKEGLLEGASRTASTVKVRRIDDSACISRSAIRKPIALARQDLALQCECGGPAAVIGSINIVSAQRLVLSPKPSRRCGLRSRVQPICAVRAD